MRVRLLHADLDFDPRAKLPAHAAAVEEDLGLGTVLDAMGGGDAYLRDVAWRVLLAAPRGGVDAILYRQEILKDCLRNPDVLAMLYRLAVEATDPKHRSFYTLARSPSSVLYEASQQMRFLVEMLERLRDLSEQYRARFDSRGFNAFFSLMDSELSGSYLDRVRGHLSDLEFRRGVLLGARLGEHAECKAYVLLPPPAGQWSWRDWWDWLLHRVPRGLTVMIAPRDESGMRAHQEIKDRGLNAAAAALARSGDHVAGFFGQLRSELAYYVASVNLHRALGKAGAPLGFPEPAPAGQRRWCFRGLCDAGLALRLGRSAVGSDLSAEGRSLGILTGANQGGKTTFLRSLGLAQLMMQAGLFVTAESFSADACSGLFTHFRREEDPTMKGGKLDEELARMSDLVDALSADALLLLNESFAATDEREGSEIARQVVAALAERRVKILFVTHLHAFARDLYAKRTPDVVFLRAERREDGTRTYRIVEGEPLRTSFGEDVYREVFPPQPEQARVGT